MSPAGTLKLTANTDREIVVERTFNAPRQLVFDAHTKPELLKRWLGVHNGWTLDVCEVDLRVGGSYRYVWRGPNGETMGMGGVYREIAAPSRIVSTERFDEAWYAGEAVGTIVLTESGGKTTMTMTIRYDSNEIRDAVLKSPMDQGLASGYNVLDGVLAKVA